MSSKPDFCFQSSERCNGKSIQAIVTNIWNVLKKKEAKGWDQRGEKNNKIKQPLMTETLRELEQKTLDDCAY